MLERHPKAEKALSDSTATVLHGDIEMATVINKLDFVFKSEKVGKAYDAYSKFLNFEKSLQ